MFYNKIIYYFYLFVTIIILFSPIKVGLQSHIFGLLLMWLTYFVFVSKSKNRKNIFLSHIKKIKSNNRFVLAISIIYVIFYPIYINFYTGQDVFTAVANVFSGSSNYYSYQEYFIDSELNKFSIDKLPFILGHALLRFLFIAIVIRVLVYQSKQTLIEKVSIGLMSSMIAITGLARGTSFELFELLLIFTFALILKNTIEKKRIISFKLIYRLGFVVVIFIIYFSYNIRTRMGDYFTGFSSGSFDTNSILFQITPEIALIFFMLYDYFGFGIFFTSQVFDKLWLDSFTGFLSMIIPKGPQLLEIDSSYRDYIGKYFNLGAKWHSDTIVLVENFGILVLFIFVIYLGIIATNLTNKLTIKIQAAIILFYIVYIMISLPVGNFILSSSANIISIFTVLILYKYKNLNKFLFNYLSLKK